MKHIPLQLSAEQQSEIVAIAKQFNKELENTKSPFPTINTLNKLKQHLKGVLFGQAGMEEVLESAKFKPQTIDLSHDKSQIRNLPWRLAYYS